MLRDGDENFTENLDSWNKNAHVVYFDQPAGVGYSIARTMQALNSDDFLSAEDNLKTLLKFFQMYPQFK